MKQQTKEKLIQRIKNYYNNPNFSYDKIEYSNVNNSIIITCLNHNDFKIIPYKLFKSKILPCPKCRKELLNFRVINTETFIKKANIIHSNKYDYSLTQYNGNSNILDINCKEHGKFEIIADEHLSSLRGCPKCANNNIKLKDKDILSRFQEIHKGYYKYTSLKRNNTNDEIEIICPNHGVFKQKINLHLLGHGCNECGYNTSNTEDFIEKVKKIHGTLYDYSKVNYFNNKTRVTIQCIKHGDFEIRPDDHLKGAGCQKCSFENIDYSSSYEKEIKEFVLKNNPNINIIERHRLGRKEIDLYFPDLNLGIEFNGTYWHSHLNKDKDYHKLKSEYFKSKNIQIFHIWEYNWINPIKKIIIKSMILNKLNLTSNRVFARKCNIKEIPGKDYREFCNNNHIQGYTPSKIKIGLYYNNKLVACMGLGNLRINLGNKIKNINNYELIRYCTLLNTNVIGGASRLLKYFENTYNPNKLISYADGDYSQGKMYENLKFNNLGLSSLSYVYFNPKEQNVKNRFTYCKQNLIKMGHDPNMTEFEIINKMKLWKIYNSGTYKFEKNY